MLSHLAAALGITTRGRCTSEKAQSIKVEVTTAAFPFETPDDVHATTLHELGHASSLAFTPVDQRMENLIKYADKQGAKRALKNALVASTVVSSIFAP
ncbi:MAG: hypothetical protein WBO35_06475 [Candidatus Saccharimonadales bacterium]|jgi:hypothetical protein